ncbi:hypothetical protein ACOMHN_039449 [Nucella lapillus]
MAEDTEAGESPSGSPVPPDHGHGHFFVKKTFHKPTYCHHCTDILWGLIGVGYVCEVCNFVVHDRCMRTVVSPCSSIATNLIKNPVAHCWSEPGHFKRKFCNVCRKRLEDSTTAIRCEICEYYAHLDCQDFVVSDCKECSTYQPHKDYIVQYHHWREGNLPPNSKCVACKKTCWSAECLAGMRCEWCGVTAHPVCYKSLPAECKFGGLRDIELPPCCLTIPRMDVPVETLLGINRKSTRTLSEEWSSSGDSKTEDEEKERHSPREKDGRDKDKDADYEVIRVYDGNGSLKKRLYRTISVPRSAPGHLLLEAALKTFHISDDPKNYYITEICDSGKNLLEGALKSCHVSEDPRKHLSDPSDSGERELDENGPIRTQLKAPDGKRPSIFLRYREKNPDRGYIRVYPGALRVSVTYKNIPVTRDTTAEEVISMALRKFGVEDIQTETISLMEVLLDKGVMERRVERGDKPWQIMQLSRRESLRQNRMTRFYLQQKEDPHGPSISLFIGNLPTGFSQRQYEKILLDIIGRENKWNSFDVIYYEYGALVLSVFTENKWNSFDVIYYEYGALVLIYTDPERTTRVFNILQEAIFDDKQLLVLLLPNIQAQMLPEGVQPLMVFVNVKSGGCQGLDLITSFRKLLNPHQVFNLDNGGPLPGLYVFRNIPYYNILVCGGDGSVGWVLSCLDNVGQDALCQSPPMAIVPLGTGNDLARVLRWGPGYSGGEDPLNVLRDVIDAEEIKLDRWTVIFHPNEKEQDETRVNIAHETNSANTNEDPTKIFVMNNYFGIGIDAEVCLDFHMAREEKPDKFNSRLHNKGVYFKIGLRRIVNRKSCKDLHRHIKVEVDGKLIDLPPVEGIVILNILSWGSGANLWGPEREDIFNKPTHYDGMLEIVGVTGVVHMGQIQSGLRTGVRIAQGGHLRITLLTDIPVQVYLLTCMHMHNFDRHVYN